MLPEEIMLTDYEELSNLLDSALNRTKSAEARDKSELLKVKESYPKLLLAIAMGHKSSNEKGEVLSRMAELEQSINDYPLIYAEIDAEELRLRKLKRDADSLVKKRERYNEVKQTLLESGGQGGSYREELYLLAAPHYLNCQDDADEFIAGFDGDYAA